MEAQVYLAVFNLNAFAAEAFNFSVGAAGEAEAADLAVGTHHAVAGRLGIAVEGEHRAHVPPRPWAANGSGDVSISGHSPFRNPTGRGVNVG